MPRPKKRTKLLSDDEGGAEEDGQNGFSINEEYARRFEHNKKREEKQKLEEKFKAGLDDSEDDSTSEDEDDDAELATADLDEEIMTTLQAIKNKDPRVYDNNVKFYKEFDPDAVGVPAKTKKEKPMRLHDYHRENLLAGRTGEEDEAEPVRTYQQEQDDLKEDLLGSLHAAIQKDDDDDEGEDGSDGDDFLVAKSKPKHASMPAAAKAKSGPRITDAEIAGADKDPETYLSNFMAARAWLPGEGSRFQAFDSDDSEEEARAEEYEAAYNMRFEDPATANEKLRSFARDVGKYGVRRDDKSGRKVAREREREKKEAVKREREEDHARLRKLKIEEAEEKISKIKEAAGLSGKDLDLEQWRDIIEGDFDDDEWDQEMKRRFGDGYYEADEAADSDVAMEDGERKRSKKSTKVKKPSWDDELDIKDLIPDFEDEQAPPNISPSDDETDGGVALTTTTADDDGEHDDEDEGATASKPSSKKLQKARAQAKLDAKRDARQTRRKIEDFVDASLPLETALASTSGGGGGGGGGGGHGPAAGFRYRETSPTSFGLTARDILFADDSQLNQYAGLKKMATFRDEERKRRDKKKFSKKGRLREWRKEVFGDADGPKVEDVRAGSGGCNDGVSRRASPLLGSTLQVPCGRLRAAASKSTLRDPDGLGPCGGRVPNFASTPDSSIPSSIPVCPFLKTPMLPCLLLCSVFSSRSRSSTSHRQSLPHRLPPLIPAFSLL
nr:protein kri1 [Quercus suber]